MPQIREIKCVNGVSAFPMTWPNNYGKINIVSLVSRVIATPIYATDSFECVWCERWQHGSCTKVCAEQAPSLQDLPSDIVFF